MRPDESASSADFANSAISIWVVNMFNTKVKVMIVYKPIRMLSIPVLKRCAMTYAATRKADTNEKCVVKLVNSFTSNSLSR